MMIETRVLLTSLMLFVVIAICMAVWGKPKTTRGGALLGIIAGLSYIGIVGSLLAMIWRW